MIKRPTLALSIAIAALSTASMAFAQTRELFGPVLPMIYDGQGGRHYCLYGYDGPFDPPIARRGDDNTIVCRSELSLTPRLKGGQFSSAKARARAEQRSELSSLKRAVSPVSVIGDRRFIAKRRSRLQQGSDK